MNTLTPIKSQLLLSEARENAERKFGASNHHYPLWVETLEGFRPCQLIRGEVDAGFERARKNPEDQPPRFVPLPPEPSIVIERASPQTLAAVALLSALVGSLVTAVLMIEWLAA